MGVLVVIHTATQWTPTFYGWVRSKSSARAKELRQLKEARIDGYATKPRLPIFRSLTDHSCRVLARLRQDGWDEEIALAGTNELKFSLSRQHFANKSVALTDAGQCFVISTMAVVD